MTDPSAIEAEMTLDPTLGDLFATESMRWIFVGGKGGVGKTTTSCSIAVELAKRREKVGCMISPARNRYQDNTGFDSVYGSRAQPQRCIHPKVHESTNTCEWIQKFVCYETAEFRMQNDETWSKVLPELISAFPGIDEALSFAELMQSVQTMDYSVIIFDTAPTGHTLRLLSFPDLLEKGFKKLQGLKQKMSGALQMMNMVSGGGIDEEEVRQRRHSRGEEAARAAAAAAATIC